MLFTFNSRFFINASRSLLITLLSGSLLGCGSGSSFGGGFLGGKTKPKGDAATPQADVIAASDTQIAASWVSFEEAMTQVPDDAVFQQFLDTPTIEFFADLEDKATNDPITIRGYTLQNPADQIGRLQPQIEDFINQFQTMGEFTEAVGIYSPSDLANADIDLGLSFVEDATSNNIIDWLAARESQRDNRTANSDTDISLESSKTSFKLTNAAGCAASVIGAIGATVAAGPACVGTAGAACAGAGIAAGAAYTSVGANCPPPPPGVVCLTNCTQEQADQAGDAMQYAIK